MSTPIYSLENALDGETISGLSTYVLDDLPLESYQQIFIDVIKNDYKNAESLLEEFIQLDSVGSFIGAHESQLLEFAVFGLILIDRLVQNRTQNKDGWESMILYEQMMECQEYIRLPSEHQTLKKAAMKAAYVKHKENREMKKQVIEYYDAHKNDFKSIDQAAKVIVQEVKLVPVTFRTVQTWISQHKKGNVQSPRKP